MTSKRCSDNSGCEVYQLLFAIVAAWDSAQTAHVSGYTLPDGEGERERQQQGGKAATFVACFYLFIIFISSSLAP